MGKTIAEKTFARVTGQKVVKAGDHVTAEFDLLYNVHLKLAEDHRRLIKAGLKNGLPKFANPNKVAILLGDDVGCEPDAEEAESLKMTRELVKKYGIKKFYDINTGIAHIVVSEEGIARPGMLICGEDSHSTYCGALNALATSLAATETIWGYLTGEIWFRVPESIKLTCNGKLQDAVTAKDVFLYIIGKYTPSLAQYKSLEWKGPIIDAMGMDGRFTLAGHSVELGAKCAPFEADKVCMDYLKATPHGKEQSWITKADPDAIYAEVLEEEFSGLAPQVAVPHGFDVVKPVTELEGIKVDQANLGSCLGARYDDLEMIARVVKGKKVKARTILSPASWNIYRRALKTGLIETLVDAGVMVTSPSCHTCDGGCAVAKGEVAIASTSRNFKGRFGSPEAEIYLASPATTAASAVTGKITDPRNLL